MAWTKEQYQAYQERKSGHPLKDALVDTDAFRFASPKVDAVAAGTELALHNEIIKECRRQGWDYTHSDPTRPATNQPGTPDFIIAADGGRTLYVECKTVAGKLSKAQENKRRKLIALGHQWLTCRSLAQFKTWAEYAGVRCSRCGHGNCRGETDCNALGAALCNGCFEGD